jgi:hypothetical protein
MTSSSVIPAKAGIHGGDASEDARAVCFAASMDPGFRRNDDACVSGGVAA